MRLFNKIGSKSILVEDIKEISILSESDKSILYINDIEFEKTSNHNLDDLWKYHSSIAALQGAIESHKIPECFAAENCAIIDLSAGIRFEKYDMSFVDTKVLF